MHIETVEKPVVSDDELKALWAETPSSRKLSRITGIPESTIRKRIRRLGETAVLIDPDRASAITQLAASIPNETAEGGKIRKARVTLWGSAAYNHKEETWSKEGLNSVSAVYEFNDPRPQWPNIVPATPSKQVVAYKPLPKSIQSDMERVWVLGDVQIGFWKQGDEYIPFHDPTAIDVALQSLGRYKPHKIVIIGDFIDFPDLSKWEQIPEFEGCMNKTIEYANALLEQIRATCPDAEIHALQGNHEKRVTTAVANRLRPFYRLRRPGDTHDLCSVPFLLNFDKHNIEVSDEYPGGQVWISDNIVCTHAPPVNRHDVRAHVIYGHHVEEAVKSYKTYYPDRARVYKTYCVPGLSDYTDTKSDKVRLCRSNVPSNRTRISATQAFATVDIVRGSGLHKVNVWEIRDGSVLFYDTVLTAALAEAA